MLERATLQVLAEAAEIGLPEAASVPAGAFDPFFRPGIKKRVRAAVANASSRVRSTAPGDHLLRVAFLSLHPDAPKDLDANDQGAVEILFRKLAAPYLPAVDEEHRPGGAYRAAARDPSAVILSAPKRTKQRWPVTTPVAIATLLGALATAAVLVAPWVIPAPSARFKKTPFGTVLGEPLTDVVASGAKIDPTLRAKILAPAVAKQIGAPAAAELARSLDAIPPAAASPAKTTDEAMASLFAAVNTLDARLADGKVPAHLHAYGQGQPERRSIWLTSYFVERRDELSLGGKPFKVVWGRRLDSLNLADSIVYKANVEEWAIVSIDRVEEELVQKILAPIARGMPIGPEDLNEYDKTPRAELARTVSPIIAKEMTDASGLGRSDADGLYRALARRNEAAIGLSKLGYSIQPSSRIELSGATLRLIANARERNPNHRALLDELVTMNERMSIYRRAVAPAIAELAQIEEEEFASSVIETERLEKSEPAKVIALVGSDKRARGVASAQLAMLARTQSCSRFALWRIGHKVLAGEAWIATGVVLTAVFRELALLPPAPPGEDEHVDTDDDTFVKALEAAILLPPERVREAATRVYTRLFDAPPPALTRKSSL